MSEHRTSNTKAYEGIGDALSWLQAAVQCGQFKWDPDQRDAAADSMNRAYAELHELRRPVPPTALVNQRDRQIAAIVTWLEKNQPDVFARGLWDAIPHGVPETKNYPRVELGCAASGQHAAFADSASNAGSTPAPGATAHETSESPDQRRARILDEAARTGDVDHYTRTVERLIAESEGESHG